MKSPTLTVAAAALVRRWTWLYTWPLPATVRQNRLAEIESDLWELQHEARSDRLNPAVQMLVRLFLGIPDDLRWSIAQASWAGRTVRVAVAFVAAALLVLALGILDLMRTRRLPVPPAVPRPGVMLTPETGRPPFKPDR
jgi:hypothetical protein